MKKENKIIVAFVVFFLLIAVIICVYYICKKSRVISDATKFRNEYMELNDKTNEELDKMYSNVNIREDNTIKYVEDEDVISTIDTKTGTLFLGNPYNSFSRTIVEDLVNEAIKNKETIYYLDISEIKTTFIFSEGKVSIDKKGTDSYYEMLKRFDEYLNSVTFEDEEGNKYSSSEKTIIIPTIISFRKGEITGFHEGTVSSQLNGYDKLSNDEKEDLIKIISNVIRSNDEEVCTKDNC